MQTRGRRGGGTWFAGVDGLVALGVGQFFVDVWRQGDVAHFRQIRFDGFGEKEQAFRAVQKFQDGRFGAAFHAQLTANAQTFSAHEGFPAQQVAATEEEQFHASARGFAGKDARGDDARLVEDEEIVRAEESAQVTKDAMLELSRVPMQDEESGGVARLERSLRDG